MKVPSYILIDLKNKLGAKLYERIQRVNRTKIREYRSVTAYVLFLLEQDAAL